MYLLCSPVPSSGKKCSIFLKYSHGGKKTLWPLDGADVHIKYIENYIIHKLQPLQELFLTFVQMLKNPTQQIINWPLRLFLKWFYNILHINSSKFIRTAETPGTPRILSMAPGVFDQNWMVGLWLHGEVIHANLLSVFSLVHLGITITTAAAEASDENQRNQHQNQPNECKENGKGGDVPIWLEELFAGDASQDIIPLVLQLLPNVCRSVRHDGEGWRRLAVTSDGSLPWYPPPAVPCTAELRLGEG